ncbi:MAG TPA: hypothetical protein VG267_19120 [Terracidiphilus sp.]|nr:hypothetical protein [Terracidiphilus sp.]
MQSTTNFPFGSPWGFGLFFAFLWCSVSFVISFISGWFSLSRRFRKQSDPYGEARSAGPWFYTVYMRLWGHYSSVIHLVAAGDALYFSVLFPFRVGHPPLRIPWEEIEVSQTKFFWRRYVQLTLGREEQIPMRISERMARKLGIDQRFSLATTIAR